MYLLQSGVSLKYVRDFLGHEDIKTTELYAKCDTELKRIAIENAYPNLIGSTLPDWDRNTFLPVAFSLLSSLHFLSLVQHTFLVNNDC